MSNGFFEKRDGVYVAPIMSIGGAQYASFFVPGNPIAAPRPRAGRNGVYHDSRADGWKSLIILHFHYQCKPELSGAVELNMQFLFLKPKKDPYRFWMEHKPDIDNLEKAVMDALTRAHAWHDDSRVVLVQSLKRYALQDETPGVHIEIVSLPQTPDLEVSTSSSGSGARGFPITKRVGACNEL